MFTLPDLSYDFNALEPTIDGRTMEIHHGKHHAAYVTNLNNALEAAGAAVSGRNLDDLLGGLEQVPEAQRAAVRNNGGGHWNHSLFWRLMNKGGDGSVSPSWRPPSSATWAACPPSARPSPRRASPASGAAGPGW
jgi:Fe-Mn family superoxide dismutase